MKYLRTPTVFLSRVLVDLVTITAAIVVILWIFSYWRSDEITLRSPVLGNREATLWLKSSRGRFWGIISLQSMSLRIDTNSWRSRQHAQPRFELMTESPWNIRLIPYWADAQHHWSAGGQSCGVVYRRRIIHSVDNVMNGISRSAWMLERASSPADTTSRELELLIPVWVVLMPLLVVPAARAWRYKRRAHPLGFQVTPVTKSEGRSAATGG